MGQLAEINEPRVIDTAGPTVCPEDLFRLAQDGDPERENEGTDLLGIYKVTEDSSETTVTEDDGAMIVFLCRVAACRNVARPNVESWVTPVMAKLANIGVTTSSIAVAEVHRINSKLARAGHVRMFCQTLDLMARIGVQDMRDGTETEMLSFLTSVASAKNLTGQDMRTWVSQVHAKLQVIQITTVKATVSWTCMLNSELRLNGLQTMHPQTLDLMARNGVALLLQKTRPSSPFQQPNRGGTRCGAPIARLFRVERSQVIQPSSSGTFPFKCQGCGTKHLPQDGTVPCLQWHRGGTDPVHYMH
jgi:hypothetical protein